MQTESGCDIIRNLNKEEQTDTPESEQHMHLELNGVVIEVHKIASVINQRSKAEDFEKWTNNSTIRHLGTFYENQGTRINLPDPTFNAFFILYHAIRHMFSEGIGYRQICDWAMFLHKNHQRINTEELKKKLKEYRLTAIWREFGILAHKVIGLSKEEIPLYPEKDESSITEELTRHIFISGNFGRFDANGRDHSQVPYLVRKWRSFTFQSRRLMKLFGLFPGYSLAYMWHWFTGAVVRFVTQADR